ncbi:PH domain-containing protein [Williamsia deligens]|uniref:PH domain-containing protein n=1 Tax=Williamsia deligens TaxID=321325 RepID=UPI0020A26978|nr:PH domain-containing protein [Williamsia deligens]
MAGAALVVGGIVLAAGAVASLSDPGGTVIMGVAAVLLIATGVVALVVRPRLVVVPGEVSLRTVRGVSHHTPAQIDRIRVVATARLGRKVPTLEFDFPDDRLVVMGRWDLGAHPDDVVDALEAAGFTVSR